MYSLLFREMRRFLRRGRSVVRLALGKGLSADLFDLYYVVKKDPWNYRTSELEQRKYRDILSVLPAGPLQRVLEIGCAEGEFTQMLAPRVSSLLALDSSPTALGRARKLNLPSVDFREVNIAREDPGGLFDLVIASEVLYYLGTVEEIQAVAQRMLTWLKPGGHLLLCHMRSQSDEDGGFAKPRWTPTHPGANTIHGIFDGFAQLKRLQEITDPLYRITLYGAV